MASFGVHNESGREDSAVASNVVAAAGLPLTVCRGRRAVDSEERSGRFGRISEDGQRQILVLGRTKSQFACKQIALDLRVDRGADWQVVAARQLGCRLHNQRRVDANVRSSPILTVIRSEEPQPVLHDVAAEVETVVRLVFGVGRRAGRVRTLRHSGVVGTQTSRRIESEEIAAELIAT